MLVVLNLMELRRRARITQQELAAAIGLRSDQTVSDWESGKRIPRLTPEQTYVICQVLNCSLEEFKNAFPRKLTA